MWLYVAPRQSCLLLDVVLYMYIVVHFFSFCIYNYNDVIAGFRGKIALVNFSLFKKFSLKKYLRLEIPHFGGN